MIALLRAQPRREISVQAHQVVCRRRVLDGLDIACATGESLVVIGVREPANPSSSNAFSVCFVPKRIDPHRRRRNRGAAARGARAPDAKFACCSRAALCSIPQRMENVAFGIIQGAAWSGWRQRKIALAKLARSGSVRGRRMRPANSLAACKSGWRCAAIAAEPEIIFFDEPTTGLTLSWPM